MVAESPTSLGEIQEIVANSERIRIKGLNDGLMWSVRATGPFRKLSVKEGLSETPLDMSKYADIVEWSPEDQVVVVKAGTFLGDLQDVLAERGQCLPMVEWYDGYSTTNFNSHSVGGSLSLNLPHYLEGVCGNWRDWILGLKVVLADGTVATCGSRAVKNVAGYDLQKLFIGARGALGIVVDVTLRTFPIASLPDPNVKFYSIESSREDYFQYQRVAASDFADFVNASEPYIRVSLPDINTLFCQLHPSKVLPRYPGDWVIRSGCGEKNVQITDPTQIRLMKRAKEIFDPTNKLNPGEWGFM